MIYRNQRQWTPIEAYHNLVGSRYYKINVNDKTRSEFKHPFYTHDKFWWDASALNLMINNVQQQAYKNPPVAITVNKARSNRQVLATATIRSKTAHPNYIDQAILRDSSYTHDLSHINQYQSGYLDNKIYVANAEDLPFGIPLGADTDIYPEEEAAATTGPKQTWFS